MRRTIASIIGAIFLFAQLGATMVSVPFEIDRISGAILVRVSVNGLPSRWFVLDTGTTPVIALTYDFATEMGFAPQEDKKVIPRFGIVTELYETTIDSVCILDDVGNVVYTAPHNEPSVILPKASVPPAVAIHDRLEIPAGVVGTRFFQGKVVTVSYDTRRILIADEISSSGWERVTLDETLVKNPIPTENHPYVAVTIADRMIPVSVDSGSEATLTFRHDLMPFLSKYIYTEAKLRNSIDPLTTRFSASGLPTPKLNGKHPLPLEGVSVRAKGPLEIPNLLGTRGMLRFNWQFDFRHPRVEVFIQPRRQQPPAGRYRYPFSLDLEWRDGHVLISAAPSSDARKAGIETDCILMSVNGVNISVNCSHINPKILLEAVERLITNPLTDKIRARVRCGDEIREVEFIIHELDWFADLERHDLVTHFEVDENGHIFVRFSGTHTVEYYWSGELQHLENTRLRVVKVDDTDIESLTAEAFIRYLHSQLTTGHAVNLHCVDESNRNILAKIHGFKPAK